MDNSKPHPGFDKLAHHSAAHPGFDAVAAKISRQDGVSPDRARAILGASTRRASAGARERNPRLDRVKG